MSEFHWSFAKILDLLMGLHGHQLEVTASMPAMCSNLNRTFPFDEKHAAGMQPLNLHIEHYDHRSHQVQTMATLQERIEALARNLPNVGPPNPRDITSRTPNFASQDTSSGKENHRPSLMTLPAELRDRIYELALYHHENAGVISPSIAIKSHGATTKVSTAGVCHDVTYLNCYQIPAADLSTFLQQALAANLVTQKAMDRYLGAGDPAVKQTALRLLIMAANAKSREQSGDPMFVYHDDNDVLHIYTGHRCTRKCLLQPSLTRLNRAIRAEALSVFYSCNAIEMRDGAVNPWQAARWWRKVGDTNLRSMESLLVSPRDGVELRFENNEYEGLRVELEVKSTKGTRLRIRLWKGEMRCAISAIVDEADHEKRSGDRGHDGDDDGDDDFDEVDADLDGASTALVPGTHSDADGSVQDGSKERERENPPTAYELSHAVAFTPRIMAAYKRIVERFAEGGLCVQTIEQAMADLIGGW
ncbi:hypothetical protein LTR86_007611 [Recurvomyces mirabilis]|nr:hypothetical protein LTR86_007611 [Recurvomyces mirabilis]